MGPKKRLAKTRNELAASGIAGLIYLPNLWWNWSHGFVSYLHVRDNAELTGLMTEVWQETRDPLRVLRATVTSARTGLKLATP